jgi:hypothetical protein
MSGLIDLATEFAAPANDRSGAQLPGRAPARRTDRRLPIARSQDRRPGEPTDPSGIWTHPASRPRPDLVPVGDDRAAGDRTRCRDGWLAAGTTLPEANVHVQL